MRTKMPTAACPAGTRRAPYHGLPLFFRIRKKDTHQALHLFVELEGLLLEVAVVLVAAVGVALLLEHRDLVPHRVHLAHLLLVPVKGGGRAQAR